jgi:hypothetical protein
LAAYTGTAERYVREWLPGQAAGGHISYDADTGNYSMSEAQALAFADPAGLLLPGAFQLAVACLSDRSMILDAFRTGRGRHLERVDPAMRAGAPGKDGAGCNAHVDAQHPLWAPTPHGQ